MEDGPAKASKKENQVSPWCLKQPWFHDYIIISESDKRRRGKKRKPGFATVPWTTVDQRMLSTCGMFEGHAKLHIICESHAWSHKPYSVKPRRRPRRWRGMWKQRWRHRTRLRTAAEEVRRWRLRRWLWRRLELLLLIRVLQDFHNNVNRNFISATGETSFSRLGRL